MGSSIKLFYASLVIFSICVILFFIAARIGWRLGIFGTGVLIQISTLLAVTVIVLSTISIFKKLKTPSSAIILILSISLIIFMNMFALWHYDNLFRNNSVLNNIFLVISGSKKDKGVE